jgi:hypothetical protein
MSGEAKFLQKYTLKSGSLLQFTDTEVESAYMEQAVGQNAGRVKIATTFLFFLLVIVHIYEFVVLAAGSMQYYNPSFLGVVGFVRISWFILLLLFRRTPKKYLEVGLCTLQTYLLCTIFGLNAFRLKRHSLVDMPPGGDYFAVWLNCDDDLAIHSRDMFLMLWIMFGEAFFNAIVPIRVIFSWIPLMCVSILFSSILIFPSLRLDDGGGTALVLIALVACSLIIWVSRFLDEKKDRKLWALTRIREAEFSWQHELVQLVFPIVVHVEDGCLKELSLVQEHFGSQVTELAHLPSKWRDGTSVLEIEELVKEVEATGHPAKRNMLIKPEGTERLIDSSVCACKNKHDGNGVILGFQVKDHWLDSGDGLVRDVVSDLAHDLESGTGSGTEGQSELSFVSSTSGTGLQDGRRVTFENASTEMAEKRACFARRDKKIDQRIAFQLRTHQVARDPSATSEDPRSIWAGYGDQLLDNACRAPHDARGSAQSGRSRKP